MANKDIAGTTQGVNPAKSFAFTVTKVTPSPSGDYCHSLILVGASKSTVFGTLTAKTHYSFFVPECLEIGHEITVSGPDLDTALANEGVAVETVTKDGSTFKRLTLMQE